ncbi:MAG: tetratricopeptide repeat protein [Owenweeksia sp.]
MRLLSYCLSVFFLLGCSQTHPELYSKTFSQEEKKELAKSLMDAIHRYYQGSPPQRFILQEAVQYDSANGDVWREAGVPYLKRGLAAGFHKHYQKAVAHNPVVWTGWRGYIYLFFYRDYDRAIADFDAQDSLTPDLVDYPQSLSVDYLRGICYLQKQELDTALYYFDKHIRYEKEISGPEYVMPQAYLYEGIAFYKRGDFKAARACYDEGLKLLPDNADLLLWKGKALWAQQKKKEAETILNRALESVRSGQKNTRPYVEEFYETYASTIEEALQKVKI